MNSVVALADHTRTIESASALQSFGDRQFFCMRASLQQDLEFNNSYIASS